MRWSLPTTTKVGGSLAEVAARPEWANTAASFGKLATLGASGKSILSIDPPMTCPVQGIATIQRHVEHRSTHPQGAGVLNAELLSVALAGK